MRADSFLYVSCYTGSVNIVTALENLAVANIDSEHDHVIETVLSKLFIRGDKVCKAYKHRSADFADLADRQVRRAYISEDFFWNNQMAPDVYLELKHVALQGDMFVHVAPDDAEDWYIVMKKIDTSRDLMRILHTRTLARHELQEFVRTLKERLSSLTTHRRHELKHLFLHNVAHVRAEVLGVCGWAYTAAPILSTSDVARAETLLAHALDVHEYWHSPIETISISIDMNPENILFLDEGVSFIDVMPPKDTWRVHDRYFALCRTSADITALASKADADILHTTYAQYDPLPDHAVRTVYELAAGLIQVPYRHMLGQTDLSHTYANFVRGHCDTLEHMYS